MNRRTVLQLGGGALVAAMAESAGAVPARPALLAFFDGRYQDAHSFARTLGSAGIRTLDTGGDVASLWHERKLDRGAARSLVGLTTYADLLIMADLARSAGLRERSLIRHDARGRTIVAHHDMLGGADLSASGEAWPLALAAHLGPIPASVGRRGGAPRRSADFPGTLWSWRFA